MGLTLINHVNQGLPAIIGDKDVIQRVVTNLLDTAIKYKGNFEVNSNLTILENPFSQEKFLTESKAGIG